MSQPVYRRRHAAGYGFEQCAAALRTPKAASEVTIREPPSDVRTGCPSFRNRGKRAID